MSTQSWCYLFYLLLTTSFISQIFLCWNNLKLLVNYGIPNTFIGRTFSKCLTDLYGNGLKLLEPYLTDYFIILDRLATNKTFCALPWVWIDIFALQNGHSLDKWLCNNELTLQNYQTSAIMSFFFFFFS